METSTHIFFGIGIGSLASLDPSLIGEPLPVYLSCILASNAPDFDYAAKLKGKSEYYKFHRGLSHSLVMLPLWAFLITAGFIPFIENPEFLQHLFIWNLIAVTIHVLTDVFNIHGTQALRPFTKKWISLDFIPLFDYFIFFMHSVGLMLVLAGHPPEKSFLIVYLIVSVYLLLRFTFRSFIYHQLSTNFIHGRGMKIIPNMDLYSWQVIIELDSDYILGRYTWGQLEVDTILKKATPPYNSWIEVSKHNQDISNFITSTSFVYPKVVERKNILEVRWIDLRFRKGRSFPFKATWVYSHNNSLEKSYVGWFHHPLQFKRIKTEMANEVNK
ncbi:metal-dependent hydrolase [Rossellomorea aquimaris]|uniref:metal-dependent hydrolase n=1 Tax=Rossellomorea aquimaris TaxID=189382 RepID=UPI001CD498CB|nr:metal-dependent hydrolase [Rossellomorea aquimaris]MCA1058408.1 metal-dependent hydrolase [Rossellomorea aquimaris]